MALAAVHGQPPRKRTAPADAYGVAECLLAGGFADQAVVDALAALVQHLDDATRAVDRRAFLVARDQEGDRSIVFAIGGHEFLGGRRPWRRVRFSCRPRRDRTESRRGRSARMGRTASARAVPGARHRCGRRSRARARRRPAHGPEIVDLAESHPLDCETQRLEPRNQEFLAAAVDGTDRRAGQQLPRQVEGGRHRCANLQGSGPIWRGPLYGRCAPRSKPRGATIR